MQVVTVEAGRARLPVAAGTGAQRLRVVETHVHRVAHLKTVQDHRIEMSAFTQRVSKFVFAQKQKINPISQDIGIYLEYRLMEGWWLVEWYCLKV